MTEGTTICVIMPSLALPERAASLRAAIESVRVQHGVRALPLVVVNGDRFDRALVSELRSLDGVRLIFRERADLPGALCAGREHVHSRWFAELDDDDLLLPGALHMRLEAARARPDCDAIVSNGYVVEHGVRTAHVASWDAVRSDPLRALVRAAWLRPGAGLFRSEAVTPEMMQRMPRYLEWTFIALQLARRGRLRFIDAKTFQYNADTPDSLSKSRAYVLGHAAAIDALLRVEMPSDVRKAFIRRRTAACNVAAQTCLRDGALGEAWRWHLRTLVNPGGWRYVPGTRRFLLRLLPRGGD
jgi:hypothetical protein